MPNFLKRAWAVWKAMAEKIGNFNARLILSLLYLLVVLPTGLLYRLVADPLRSKPKSSNWVPKPPAQEPRNYTKQF